MCIRDSQKQSGGTMGLGWCPPLFSSRGVHYQCSWILILQFSSSSRRPPASFWRPVTSYYRTTSPVKTFLCLCIRICYLSTCTHVGCWCWQEWRELMKFCLPYNHWLSDTDNISIIIHHAAVQIVVVQHSAGWSDALSLCISQTASRLSGVGISQLSVV